MTQKIAVVTGASAGVGMAAAAMLLIRGWRVFGVGRNPDRCAHAAAALSELGQFDMLQADLSDLTQVARVADSISAQVPHINALLNNAGGVTAERMLTAQGHESNFAGNHLAPFLLMKKLLPLLRKGAETGGARVVAVSSTGHEHCAAIRFDDLNFEQGFVGGAAYCHAKLANILFTRELARREGGNGVIAHAMHPGVVDSNFASHCEPGMRAYMESIKDRAVTPDHAAQTLVWLAESGEAGRKNRLYWFDKMEAVAAPQAMDDDVAARLWAVSETLVAGY